MSCLASFCTNHHCGQGLHMCASAQMLMGPSVVTFTNSQRRSKDMVRAPLMSSWISTCTRNSNHQKYRSICERCITSCPRGNDPENRQPSQPWLMVVHLPNECVHVQSPFRGGQHRFSVGHSQPTAHRARGPKSSTFPLLSCAYPRPELICVAAADPDLSSEPASCGGAGTSL